MLSGGLSNFSGLKERLQKELLKFVSPDFKITLNDPIGGQNITWLGASILASSNQINDYWITKNEYERQGSGIIDQIMSQIGILSSSV